MNSDTTILIQNYQIDPSLLSKQNVVYSIYTVIKTFSGNLETSDAEKYDETIESLSSKQNKTKTLVKRKITFIKSSVDKFYK